MNDHRALIDPPASVRPAEDLAALATRINAEHEAAEAATREGLERFRRAGEALLRAKARLGHGQWLPWLKKHVRFSYREASRYMRLAEGWDKLDTVSNLTEGLRLLTEEAAPDLEGDTPPATPDDEPDVPAFVPGEGTLAEVLAGKASCHATRADVLDFFRAPPAGSLDLVIGSPPYPEKGERYAGARKEWDTPAWVEWMVEVTRAAATACRGSVLWVVNGSVRDGVYLPACEGLVWEYWKRYGGTERPCVWHKNAPPNREDWFGNDWEFVLAFGKPVRWNWQAVAGPPKYTSGGRFRQRDTNGERRLGGEYPTNELARPRDVFRVTVGGGHMGSDLAHENEAPFPEGIVEPFVLCLTDPGDTVCDPFMGSGTTAVVALRHGRRFVGCDFRQDQVDLTRRRVAAELAPKTEAG
jgi:adenine-specific DNA-methyltransferase